MAVSEVGRPGQRRFNAGSLADSPFQGKRYPRNHEQHIISRRRQPLIGPSQGISVASAQRIWRHQTQADLVGNQDPPTSAGSTSMQQSVDLLRQSLLTLLARLPGLRRLGTEGVVGQQSQAVNQHNGGVRFAFDGTAGIPRRLERSPLRSPVGAMSPNAPFHFFFHFLL